MATTTATATRTAKLISYPDLPRPRESEIWVRDYGKTAIGLVSKTTTLHVHHAFLYISLPSLHDYKVKMPNFTFMENVNKERRIFLSLSKLESGRQEINSRETRPHFTFSVNWNKRDKV